MFALAQVNKGKVNMVVSVQGKAADQLKAPDLLNQVGELVGVKGGGRPDLARGGGGDKPDALAEALAKAYDVCSNTLS